MIGRPFRMEWHEKDTPAALKEAYLSQEDVSIRSRLHVLWLLRRGWRITAAAGAVGVHYRSAQRWVEWYRGRRPQRSCVSQDGRCGSAALSERRTGTQAGGGGWWRTVQNRRRDRGLDRVGVWGPLQGEQHIQFAAAAGGVHQRFQDPDMRRQTWRLRIPGKRGAWSFPSEIGSEGGNADWVLPTR